MKVMGKVISEPQSAFLKDRFILDGPLMVNEVMEWLKKRNHKAFMLKIDFEKAYDNVNWNFWLSILAQMGFPQVWCGWIKGILVSARAAVLVNVSPTFEFMCEKGLRQGDPISPFLFLIVMEALSWLLKKAREIGEFKGINFADNEADITHLFYADDALILGEWSRENLQNIEVDNMMEILGCKRGGFPFVYLGVHVGTNMSRISNWNLVVEVIKARLASWKARTLSMGGRLILIKSVLESLPIYYLSLYKAPKAVIESIEASMRRFLWAGCSEERKIPWVAWDVITTPKKEGGLGVTKLQDVNEALLLKWTWRFKKEGNCLWKKVVTGCHSSSRAWTMLPCSPSASGCWKQIVKIGEKRLPNGNSLISYFVGIPGDGSTINFWGDTWLREDPLRIIYPNLFRLEKHKWAPVSSRLQCVNGEKILSWDWRSVPSSFDELIELLHLLEDIHDYNWVGGVDVWKWKGDSNGIFSMSAAKKLLASTSMLINASNIKWKGWVPLKCKIMVWSASLNRLPTRLELQKRGVPMQNVSCVLCNSDSETAIHMFTGCVFSAEIWARVASWCRLSAMFAFDVPDLLKMAENHTNTKKAKYILRGIIYTTMWVLWERNARILKENFRSKITTFLVVSSVMCDEESISSHSDVSAIWGVTPFRRSIAEITDIGAFKDKYGNLAVYNAWSYTPEN
ncbi:uncharacterized protein LOC110866487 [Helianthus annuus]|uniref:uncharacterized protein LOC110866487 n=1 Tax=Helianthus annuus TaxID=4232 RepID=UPI000B8FCA5D|nr:uncharacterized protein LOC110866487 [Helianthus annuus]